VVASDDSRDTLNETVFDRLIPHIHWQAGQSASDHRPGPSAVRDKVGISFNV